MMHEARAVAHSLTHIKIDHYGGWSAAWAGDEGLACDMAIKKIPPPGRIYIFAEES